MKFSKDDVRMTACYRLVQGSCDMMIWWHYDVMMKYWKDDRMMTHCYKLVPRSYFFFLSYLGESNMMIWWYYDIMMLCWNTEKMTGWWPIAINWFREAISSSCHISGKVIRSGAAAAAKRGREDWFDFRRKIFCSLNRFDHQLRNPKISTYFLGTLIVIWSGTKKILSKYLTSLYIWNISEHQLRTLTMSTYFLGRMRLSPIWPRTNTSFYSIL